MYIGQTSRPLRVRIAEHIRSIRTRGPTSVALHFNADCSLSDFSFTALEHCPKTEKRLQKENIWIKRFNTLQPNGLNAELNASKDILRMILPFSDCSAQFFNVCKKEIPDVTISASHTTARNLRQLLRTA